MGLGMAGNL
jgi:3-hydroxyisobutyrate dehydrogenase-like beta-hydroxyacid dehydrogenase